MKYLAFLRAINVGGHTVKMETLRALFGELGFANVATFIASGNVIFEATAASPEDLEARIERHLEAALGYAVGTFIRGAGELAAIAGYAPFPPADVEQSYNLYISFLKAPLGDAPRRQVLALGTETDEFHAHGRELYWLCRTRLSDSPVSGPRLEKAIGAPSTMRNITTIRKLAAKYGSD